MRTSSFLLFTLLAAATVLGAASADAEDSSSIAHLGRNNISLAYKGDWVVVVYANWCPHCRSLMEDLPELADALDGKARVALVEGDENVWAQAQFLLTAFPAIYHFHNGEARMFEGSPSEDAIEEFALSGWKGVEPVPWWRSPAALHMRGIAAYTEFVMGIYAHIEVLADRWDLDPLYLTIAIVVLSFALFLGSFHLAVTRGKGKKKPTAAAAVPRPNPQDQQAQKVPSDKQTQQTSKNKKRKNGTPKKDKRD